MKFFQVLLLACVAVCYIKAEDVTKDTIKKYAIECKEELHATDAEGVDLFKPRIAKDQTEKCLRACMMKKLKVMDDKSRLIKDRALEIVAQLSEGNEDLKKLGEDFVKDCSDIEVPEDQCEAAEVYNLCMLITVYADTDKGKKIKDVTPTE